MKFVMAVIKPHKLEGVREALSDVGVEGMTISEVKGYGRQRGQAEIYRGQEYAIDFLPKVKLEIGVSDDQVDTVIDAIQKSAHTGSIGDGKVFVYDMASSLRIRTGEVDDDAL